MHTFCALKMQPKLPFHPSASVKACTKSSHHDVFVYALSFGWLGDVFSVLIVQKLAILADLIHQLSTE
jgi:hypothetical protein